MRFRVAVVLAVSLVACGSSAARPAKTASVPPVKCAPAGAQLLASDRQVQVYSRSGGVYACDGGTSVRLGNATLCIGTARVDRAAVAGDLVAYGSERCGVDTGSASVSVLRLANDKQLHTFAAVTGAIGPEAYQKIDAIVVKRDSAVAWISTVTSIIGRGSDTEVHANDKLLDSGTAIVQNSLRLHRSTLTWRDGAQTRSATLR